MQKPWINNFQSNGFKGACIACCHRKTVRRCCGCNISIRLSDSLSGYSIAHHQFRVKLRRSEIEGEDTLGKMRKHFSFEPIVKNGLPFPRGHGPDTKTKLSNRCGKKKSVSIACASNQAITVWSGTGFQGSDITLVSSRIIRKSSVLQVSHRDPAAELRRPNWRGQRRAQCPLIASPA